MRIPLELYTPKDKFGMRLRASASIRFGNRAPTGVTFIVDTGSPVTFVDEFVSSKVRMYTKNLEFDHNALMGGTKVAMYNAGAVTIDFRDAEYTLAKMQIENMMVARTEWSRKGAIYSAVSILGLDFLSETKTTLVVDPNNEVAYIE